MSRLYVLQPGVTKVTEVGRNWGMDLAGGGVLGHMLLIPSLIFLAVIELASRIAERRTAG
jgi:hypothetical protein